MAKKSLEATLATLEEAEIETPEAEPDYISEEIEPPNTDVLDPLQLLNLRFDQFEEKVITILNDAIKQILGRKRPKYQRRSLLPKGKD